MQRRSVQRKDKKMVVSKSGLDEVKPNLPLRIGFDLDGVILSNPIRIFRSFVSTGKRMGLLPRRDLEFYVPKSKLEEKLWFYLHKSSWRLADGFQVLQRLVAEGKIEAYIVSARFACLAGDSENWVKKINSLDTFKQIYFNNNNEQPHLFKSKMIKQLKLDYFVEDNLDVASYLTTDQKKVEIWWLSNLVDARIDFAHKFNSFSRIMNKFAELINK